MNHNSYPSSGEDQNSSQSNSNYDLWQETLKDVEFQGGKISSQADQETVTAPKWDLTKVSGQLGSNEGGWYEKPTGERFYVKFYEKPSQGQAEFVANAIYEKLGIKAVRSEIIQLDGREAVASPAVPDATPASMEVQQNSEDVQKGFVADAFLANWDVVGLVYDNIVQGEGGLYRIDNGGSLIFRAQGGNKAYPPDSIPELQSMLKPGRPAGEVFAGITEEEIGRQARELVDKISPEDIRAIVDESGLEGEDRNRILTGLLGRREYLAKTYGEPTPSAEGERRPRRRASETIRLLNDQEIERTDETAVRPKTEIVCDHNHIEGQKIDVINKRDRGTTEFRFKLRAPTEAIATMAARLGGEGDTNQIEATTPSGAVLGRGKITYEGASSDSSYDLCDAYVFEKGGVKVFIADPASRDGGKWRISGTHNDSGLIRTAMGLVKAEAPFGMAPEDTERVLGEILEKDLGIPNALGEVPEEAEKEYKLARYKWQHAVTNELTPEQMGRAEKLTREEVFPGYTTLVESGKHKEYLEKYGEDMRAIHQLSTGNARSIYRILTQGLMCTTERYSRGLIRNGLSSSTDIDTGGADSVFTRIANETRRGGLNGTVVVFKPEVFDRTDWYSYESDTFGSTDDAAFAGRLSPDAIFTMTTAHGYYPSHNEQMFRTGIGANFVESVEVDPNSRGAIIAELRSMGLNEANGRPIEEIVVSRQVTQPETTADFTGGYDPFNDPFSMSPEEYAAHQKKIEQEKAEKQAKMQAIINGEEPYASVQEIVMLANSGDNFGASFKSMVEAIVAHGEKEKLASDMANYLKEELTTEELKMLVTGDMMDDLPEAELEDLEVLQYLQSALGIDYNALYEMAQASPPESSSKSVDDWM